MTDRMRGVVRNTVTAAISSCVAVASAAAVGWWAFGSVQAIPGLVMGRVVVAGRSTVDAGRLAPGESRRIAFTLTNIRSQAVTVQGARTSCTCVHLANLPVEILPGRSRDVEVVVRPGAQQGGMHLTQTIDLFLSTRGPAVPLTVTLFVAGAPASG